jgi:CRP-like cAMP-binding protein
VEWQVLSALTEPDRQAVLGATRRRRFARREVVFHEGDPGDTLHLLRRGHVAVRMTTPMGDIATIRVLGPGELFGELAIIAPGPRNATVVALDQVETLALGGGDFTEVRRRHPAVDRLLLDSAVSEMMRLTAQLTEALFVPAPKRVLRRLVEVAALWNGEAIPLTQDDLAQLAGTTRPTANRILKEAESAGLLAVSRGRITVLDRPSLESKAR